MTLQVSSAFDGGAIVVEAIDGRNAALRIRSDIRVDGAPGEFAQWFYFRVSGAEAAGARVTLVNAASTTYPDGWRDYRAVASWDRKHWVRLDSTYDGSTLAIELPPAPAPSYIAYFEPYSWERHLQLLADSCARGARLRSLGRTLQGRDVDALIVGDGPLVVWIIARQHPGETMAEWFVEGLLERLLDPADPLSRALRQRATFYVVANMNPDGSVLGNLRTNAAGANLNREWLEPSLVRSPEVKCVRDAMHDTGCDAFFDVHGDENLPYVFVAGAEMLPGFTAAQAADQQAFAADFSATSPDFQTRVGYEASKYREDVLKLASKYVGHSFGCLSLTLEMPFKDNANAPDNRFGWSAARSARLGAAMLGPLYRHLVRSR